MNNVTFIMEITLVEFKLLLIISSRKLKSYFSTFSFGIANTRFALKF